MTVTSSESLPASTDIVAQLRRFRLVPVIVIDDAEVAPALGRALAGGGLPCAEVTFRTRGAREALKRIATECPDVLAGAGTVLTPAQAREARDAGARFVVSPGFNPAVVDYCLENGIPVFPGIATPTELESALSHGLEVLKFFPAEPLGGLPYLKAIAAPYGGVEFMPTGGITLQNVGGYLSFSRVLACGGSWMAPPELIAARNFTKIEEEVRKAVAAVTRANGVNDT